MALVGVCTSARFSSCSSLSWACKLAYSSTEFSSSIANVPARASSSATLDSRAGTDVSAWNCLKDFLSKLHTHKTQNINTTRGSTKTKQFVRVEQSAMHTTPLRRQDGRTHPSSWEEKLKQELHSGGVRKGLGSAPSTSRGRDNRNKTFSYNESFVFPF